MSLKPTWMDSKRRRKARVKGKQKLSDSEVKFKKHKLLYALILAFDRLRRKSLAKTRCKQKWFYFLLAKQELMSVGMRAS